MDKLSEASLMIVDCGINISTISDPENVFESLSITLQKEREELQEEWDDLVQKNIIAKEDYSWVINPSNRDEVIKQWEELLKDKNITPEHTVALLEGYIKEEPTKLSLLIKTMG